MSRAQQLEIRRVSPNTFYWQILSDTCVFFCTSLFYNNARSMETTDDFATILTIFFHLVFCSAVQVELTK